MNRSQLVKKYANALYILLKQKDKDVNLILKNFFSLLKRNGHFPILKDVFKTLIQILESEKNNKKIELILADLKDKDKFFKKAENFKKHFLKDGDIDVLEDKTLIGGFIIKTKFSIIDSSYKRLLLNFYKKVTE